MQFSRKRLSGFVLADGKELGQMRRHSYLQSVPKSGDKKKKRKPSAWVVVLGIDLAYVLMYAEVPSGYREGRWLGNYGFFEGWLVPRTKAPRYWAELMLFIALQPCVPWGGRAVR